MNLEAKFDQRMKDIYTRAKNEEKYNASYFIKIVAENGGLAAAKKLISHKEGSLGFTKLWELGRLDLSVESLVIEKEFSSLFTTEEIDMCKIKRIWIY